MTVAALAGPAMSSTASPIKAHTHPINPSSCRCITLSISLTSVRRAGHPEVDPARISAPISSLEPDRIHLPVIGGSGVGGDDDLVKHRVTGDTQVGQRLATRGEALAV